MADLGRMEDLPEDYRAAGVPMLPVIATEQQVTKQILVYTWLTVAATMAPGKRLQPVPRMYKAILRKVIGKRPVAGQLAQKIPNLRLVAPDQFPECCRIL